jgi:hypothetical protein
MLIKLDGIRSAQEAMEKSGLAWSVEQAQLMTCNGGHAQGSVPGRHEQVRENNAVTGP